MSDVNAYFAQARVYRRYHLFGHKLNHESRHSGQRGLIQHQLVFGGRAARKFHGLTFVSHIDVEIVFVK